MTKIKCPHCDKEIELIAKVPINPAHAAKKPVRKPAAKKPVKSASKKKVVKK
jgi:hypothetical protein